MGLIFQRIQSLKDKYEHCLKVANKIYTKELHSEMLIFVYNCFKVLKPLSREPDVVLRKGDTDIIIGDWISEKKRWHTRGWAVIDEYDFLEIIREFGEEIKPHVRKAISAEFASLVDLAVKLVPYSTTEFKIDIPPTKVYRCNIYNEIDMNEVNVIALGVTTNEPLEVMLFYGENGYVSLKLRDVGTVLTIEDLMDHMVKLYDLAESQISPIIDHNNKIIEEMKKVVAPLIVARELHR